jgi:hypothetical protein
MLGFSPEPMRLPAIGVLLAAEITEYLDSTKGLGAALMTGFGRRSTLEAIDVRV